MPEVIIQNFEPKTKIIETWWAVNPGKPDGHPHSWGSDEDACRAYVKEHPGYHLEVFRIWQTDIMQIVRVTDA